MFELFLFISVLWLFCSFMVLIYHLADGVHENVPLYYTFIVALTKAIIWPIKLYKDIKQRIKDEL